MNQQKNLLIMNLNEKIPMIELRDEELMCELCGKNMLREDHNYCDICGDCNEE